MGTSSGSRPDWNRLVRSPIRSPRQAALDSVLPWCGQRSGSHGQDCSQGRGRVVRTPGRRCVGTGQDRRPVRGRTALNAFDITFDVVEAVRRAGEGMRPFCSVEHGGDLVAGVEETAVGRIQTVDGEVARELQRSVPNTSIVSRTMRRTLSTVQDRSLVTMMSGSVANARDRASTG